VAIVADLLEERWPSMNLVADMLLAQLRAPKYARAFQVEMLRPALDERGGPVGRYVNRYWDYSRWLRTRNGQFDLFHVVDHSYAHLVHVLPPERTVVTCHDVDAFMPLVDRTAIATRLPKTVTRWVLSGMRKAACITCVSGATRDDLTRFHLADVERLVVVANGVQPALYGEPGAEAEDTLSRLLGSCRPSMAGTGTNTASPALADAPRHTLDVLHVGTCIPRKRIDVLLRAVAAIAALRPDVRLLKAGGQLTAEQRELAAALGIADRIVQLPFVAPDVLAALYRRADVVLVTSEREGFGLPVVEALAAGTPVVATDLPVLREVGADVVSYVPIDEIALWCDAVLRIATPSDFAQGYRARRAREARAGRFTWEQAASQTAHVYERVLNGATAVAC
jgi:glycosyltransferase involved in cell wall biosynthesis